LPAVCFPAIIIVPAAALCCAAWRAASIVEGRLG
jgi:hypothetical protein